MSENLVIKIDDKVLNEKLTELVQKSKNLRPVMRKLAESMLEATQRNFDTEGSRLNKPWQDLAKRTQKQREKKGYGANSPKLQQKRFLFQSLSAKADDNKAVVGTNLIYARIHQLGGEIEHPARTRIMHFKKHKKGKFEGKTLFSSEKEATHGMKKASSAYKIKIPARPFLGLNSGDINNLKNTIIRYLQQ